jgi:hypothetical protein
MKTATNVSVWANTLNSNHTSPVSSSLMFILSLSSYPFFANKSMSVLSANSPPMVHPLAIYLQTIHLATRMSICMSATKSLT